VYAYRRLEDSTDYDGFLPFCEVLLKNSCIGYLRLIFSSVHLSITNSKHC
jgi:hypothetical protein